MFVLETLYRHTDLEYREESHVGISKETKEP